MAYILSADERGNKKFIFLKTLTPLHFLKIHRNVLRKITTDLLYFWDVYDVNLWEKISAEVRLIYAEKYLYIISSFGEKTIDTAED